MPSRSPSRSRSPSPLRSQGRPRSQSPEQSHLPRRSYSPRSRRSDVSRSRSRSRTPRSVHDRRNGDRDERVTSRSPSRSRSLSRSVSRGRSDRRYRDRSYTRSPSRGTPPRTSSKIVVEKLTKNVNENHLREIFGTYGEIRSLELPMNPQFMTNRGTAYILYYEAADAEAAISHMHEAQLDGAVLNVSIVLPRRTFSRSPPPARNRPDFSRFDRPPYGGGYGRPSGLDARGPPPSRYRSPPPRRRSPRRFPGGRGMERHDLYRPRSISRSRSPRGRSLSYSSRSRSRSPPPRRRLSRRDSPPRRRRRESSYSSYSDRNDSRSRSRTRSRSRSRDRYSGSKR
ncbi:hypothetical protein FQN53_004575 [Emmonsiellopsis sp. PD_33]|nr:hypothetical protein FQN53_004575 [Emmonsiellopsis sp. PD_33]